MSCPACFQGAVRQDREPSGHTTSIYGRETYIADPPDGCQAKGIIVIIPDAFGWEFVNNRLLADEYAHQGHFKVYLPDFADGTASPIWVMDSLVAVFDTKSFRAWITKPYHLVFALYGMGLFLLRNRLSVSMPKVNKFLSEVRHSEGKDLHIGAAGFCWGGQHIVRLAHGPVEESSLVNALFTAHPSMLSIPDDIKDIRKPLSIAVGDSDHLISGKEIKQIEETLQENEVLHEVVIYEGAGHGFSIRIDRVNPNQADQAVQAEKQAVDWFTKCFKIDRK